MKKILVVEDQETLRRRYKEELSKVGYDVRTAANGSDAFKKMIEEPVDLMVLELNLPDGVGIDCLRKFVDRKKRLKVIINTDCPTYQWDFRTWAADAFLLKSDDLTELKNTIEQVLN